jgi:hypothetical protein
MHCALEEWWGVGEAEIYDSGNIGALWGFKHCLLLVFFGNVYVVIPPADVKLREE